MEPSFSEQYLNGIVEREEISTKNLIRGSSQSPSRAAASSAVRWKGRGWNIISFTTN